jgi:hypothetical protein
MGLLKALFERLARRREPMTRLNALRHLVTDPPKGSWLGWKRRYECPSCLKVYAVRAERTWQRGQPITLRRCFSCMESVVGVRQRAA